MMGGDGQRTRPEQLPQTPGNSELSVALDDREIVSRLTGYLSGAGKPAARAIDSLLAGPFRGLGRTAIVGGMVRDIARGTEFSTDIDLVVEDSAAHVADVALSLGARPNVMGGWTAAYEGFDIDFWALQSSWAVRAGHVDARVLEDFPKTTFFRHDAAAFDIVNLKMISSEVFWHDLRTQAIEINLEPTPVPVGNIYRAAKRILLWGLRPGPSLAAFIDRNLNTSCFAALLEMGARKGDRPFLAPFANAPELIDALLYKGIRRW